MAVCINTVREQLNLSLRSVMILVLVQSTKLLLCRVLSIVRDVFDTGLYDTLRY
jgi:hypothetical protein